MPVGVDFPSRLDPCFQSTSKSPKCQRFKNLVSLTEKLVLAIAAGYASSVVRLIETFEDVNGL